MKIVFAGTPEFAAVALRALLAAGFEVPLVMCQPDRPSGRGMQLQSGPVKLVALEHLLPVAQPTSLRLDGKYPNEARHAKEFLESIEFDVMVVAAYGLILPRWVLDLPRLGCINIHASLLPRWRGAAPIHRAIEAGDSETGITIMQMDEGLDTGPMLLTHRLPISPEDTTASLHDKLAELGGQAIVAALQQLEEGKLTATPQPAEDTCYATKISKEEAAIDWQLPASQLERKIRALNPAPGTVSQFKDMTIKIWRAQVVSGQGQAGEVLQVDHNGIVVACGTGALSLQELQKPGGKRLAVAELLKGFAVAPGDRFA